MKGVFKTMVSRADSFGSDAWLVADLCDKANVRMDIEGSLVYFYSREKGDVRGLPVSNASQVVEALKAYIADNEDTETPEEREVFEAMSESVNWQGSHTAFGNKYKTDVNYYDRLNQCLCRLVGPVLDDGAACIVERLDEDLTGVYLLTEWAALETPEERAEREYEAGKKLRELWLSCFPEKGVTLHFENLGSDHRNAWIELAKRVKVLDNKE